MDGDGQISEIEMYPQNQKDNEDRMSSNAFGNSWYKNAKVKSQLSPRFALAFPITDKGHMHFSYGHFLQSLSIVICIQILNFSFLQGVVRVIQWAMGT